MAAANAAQPAPDQAKPLTSTPALDNLQAMMNLVLVQCGRYIGEQRDGATLGRNAFNLKRAVPAAIERFQDSLDDLENELHQAQAVLRRDLAVLQADRIKREQAEAAERLRLQAESSAKKATPAPKPDPDLVMTDEPKPSTVAHTMTTAQIPETKEETEPEVKEEPKQEPPATTNAPEPIDTTIESLPDPLFDGTPTTANPQENTFDFDAMFGPGDDMGDANAGTDMNLDSTTADLDFTMDDSAPSLLRGLEDFAKTEDDATAAQATLDLDMDFTMPDISADNNSNNNNTNANDNDNAKNNNATNAAPAPEETKPSAQPTTSQPAEEQPQEEQPQEEQPNTDQDNLLDTMVTDNLDDLFDLGEYQNPEGTSFDDAFFGFGE